MAVLQREPVAGLAPDEHCERASRTLGPIRRHRTRKPARMTVKRAGPVKQRDELGPLDHPRSAPPVWTWIIPLLAGTAVYFAFAEKLELQEGPTIWWEELLEASPALMVGLLYQTFVLLPLRMLFARARMNNPVLFLAVSTLAWLALSVAILHWTNMLSQGDLWVDASVIVPGLVVAVAFTLMDRYSSRR
jgi:hypothetical protein